MEQIGLGVEAGQLWFGDNLEVLRRHVADESVDLVYLDPPFNSNKAYNVLFQHRDGRKAAGQVKAFDDTWRWDMAAADVFQQVVAEGDDVSKAMLAFRTLIGTTDMLAYLTMMVPRLVELHRVLASTGSLYLHCDQSASHYLKVLLDAVFGPTNFRNEISWKRTYTHGNVGKNYGAVVDSVFFYTKSTDYKWNQPYTTMDPEYVKKRFTGKDADGRLWQSVTLRNPSVRPNLHYLFTASNGTTYKPHPNGWAVGPERMAKYDAESRLHFPAKIDGQLRVKQYLDETPGVKVSNLWDDIYPINSQAAERLGYPTQKPIALLDRIIAASSDPGDVVLDPFCGCGTAVDAAHALGRQWIGIDITKVAIEIIQQRLNDQYGNLVCKLGGEPTTVEDAVALAELDKHEFQHWVCRRVGVKEQRKKGADRGIDGNFAGMFDNGDAWTGILSVKGGATSVAHVRDLRGTVERDKADFGVLVCLKPPTKAMRRDAADAGFTHEGVARIQIVTVASLLDGHGPALPKAAARPSAEVSVVGRRLRAV